MGTDKLLRTLGQIKIKETYFGPQGFVIANTQSELQAAQIGYAIHPDGVDLTGFRSGEWQKSWLVFGRDTELGDPYFVDTSEQQLPVYTAMQIEGLWQPEAVASSLASFMQCLALLRTHATQEIAQFVPDETSLVDKEVLKQLHTNLVEISGCASFWTLFFECYNDWLQDDD